MSPNKMVLKKVDVLSLLTLSIIFAALAYTITAGANADYAGWAEWYNPDTSAWEVIPPSPNHLKLWPEDLPIQIRICGLSSFIGQTIQIKVENEDWFYSSDRVQLITGDCTDPFLWPDPDHPYDYEICVTNVIQFREFTLHPAYVPPQVYIVSGIIGGDDIPARIHIIPEYAFGTVMAILSSLSGLAAYTKYRRK